ncbi:hypothetical protein ABPG74_021679 [Tetrahymena malaccensis]
MNFGFELQYRNSQYISHQDLPLTKLKEYLQPSQIQYQESDEKKQSKNAKYFNESFNQIATYREDSSSIKCGKEKTCENDRSNISEIETLDRQTKQQENNNFLSDITLEEQFNCGNQCFHESQLHFPINQYSRIISQDYQYSNLFDQIKNNSQLKDQKNIFSQKRKQKLSSKEYDDMIEQEYEKQQGTNIIKQLSSEGQDTMIEQYRMQQSEFSLEEQDYIVEKEQQNEQVRCIFDIIKSVEEKQENMSLVEKNRQAIIFV